MAIASALHAHVHTIDVNLAFLYANTDIDIYIRPSRHQLGTRRLWQTTGKTCHQGPSR